MKPRDPPQQSAVIPKLDSRHRLTAGTVVLAKSVLDGLHHEYSLTAEGANAEAIVGELAQKGTARNFCRPQ